MCVNVQAVEAAWHCGAHIAEKKQNGDSADRVSRRARGVRPWKCPVGKKKEAKRRKKNVHAGALQIATADIKRRACTKMHASTSETFPEIQTGGERTKRQKCIPKQAVRTVPQVSEVFHHGTCYTKREVQRVAINSCSSLRKRTSQAEHCECSHDVGKKMRAGGRARSQPKKQQKRHNIQGRKTLEKKEDVKEQKSRQYRAKVKACCRSLSPHMFRRADVVKGKRLKKRKQ